MMRGNRKRVDHQHHHHPFLPVQFVRLLFVGAVYHIICLTVRSSSNNRYSVSSPVHIIWPCTSESGVAKMLTVIGWCERWLSYKPRKNPQNETQSVSNDIKSIRLKIYVKQLQNDKFGKTVDFFVTCSYPGHLWR